MNCGKIVWMDCEMTGKCFDQTTKFVILTNIYSLFIRLRCRKMSCDRTVNGCNR